METIWAQIPARLVRTYFIFMFWATLFLSVHITIEHVRYSQTTKRVNKIISNGRIRGGGLLTPNFEAQIFAAAASPLTQILDPHLRMHKCEWYHISYRPLSCRTHLMICALPTPTLLEESV